MAVVYGTPQVQNLSGVSAKDRNNYLPPHLQEARDENGRRRFHGAFTGGFSAGYFNTVGSKEGWTVTDYVSSKTNRKTVTHAPENYMDLEDLEDYKKVVKVDFEYDDTKSRFVMQKHDQELLAERASEFPAAQMLASAVVDIFFNSECDLSTKLLRAFGWKKYDDSKGLIGENLQPKTNVGRRGLGYEVLGTLDDSSKVMQTTQPSRFENAEPRVKRSRVLGFSLFDEDNLIYSSSNSKSTYDQYISNPSRDVQQTHTYSSEKYVYPRQIKDVIQGFVHSNSSLKPKPLLPRIKVPDDYKPKPIIISLSLSEMTSDRNNPKDFTKQDDIIGSVRKSVFSYLSADSQKRLAEYLDSSIKSRNVRKQLLNKVADSKQSVVSKTSIDAETARSALRGYIPFEDEPEKRDRYFKFLIIHSKQAKLDMCYPAKMSSQDISHEITEFTKAAIMFRSSSSSISLRFTSAKNPQILAPQKVEIITTPSSKNPSPESTQAALAGVYGTLTRSIKPFYPEKLLSKRFNLPPVKAPQQPETTRMPHLSSITSTQGNQNINNDIQNDTGISSKSELDYSLVKEVEKPTLDIFKAIFCDTPQKDKPSKPPQKSIQSVSLTCLDKDDEELQVSLKKPFSPAAFRPLFKSKSSRNT